MNDSPFHEGEVRAQKLAREHDRAVRIGRAIGPTIPGPALAFVAEQRYAVVATEDERGAPWVSLLFGEAGFVSATPETLNFDLVRSQVAAKDPMLTHLRGSSRIGLLFIELATRRRLRVNGRVSARSSGALRVDVEQGYSNCPKYIQRRDLLSLDTPSTSSTSAAEVGAGLRAGVRLGPHEAHWLERSDTLFVASRHPERGLDASHRGGVPGFVQVDLEAQSLSIPDYAGNSMFNTFGNLLVEPRVALLAVDFERGRALHLVGRSSIEWEADESTAARTGGTGRMWTVHVERWLELPLAVAASWSPPEPSPFNPPG